MVADALRQNNESAIAVLKLPNNKLPIKVVDSFAAVLGQAERPLHELDLANNGVSKQGACLWFV